MAGQIREEMRGAHTPLVTSREPVGPIRAGDKGSVGDTALTDALFIVGIAWVLIGLTVFSLRGFNI
jgi:hypothetical protein